MDKKVLMIGAALVIAVIGGSVYLLTNSDASTMKPSTTAVSTDTTSPDASLEAATTAAQPGAYVEYSSRVIAETPGTKLLFFHAAWCPQCRALEADIKAKGVPAGVTIIKVDYDTNQALRQKYGVTLQTTVVAVDDQGNALRKFVAYDEPSLAAIKENLL